MMELVKRYLTMAADYSQHYKLMFEDSTQGFVPSNKTREVAIAAFEELTKRVAKLPNLSIRSEVMATELWALAHGFVCFGNHPSYDILPREKWQVAAVEACSAHIRARTAA